MTSSNLSRLPARIVFALLCALSLSGCIDSASPILFDSRDVFGPKLHLQLYALRKGYARDPEQATYIWNGALYTHAGGGMRDVSAFSIHPFESGDYIIETVPAKRGSITEYAVVHRLAEGVFQIWPIDENDADDPTRAAFCKHVDNSACRIETREQLFAFARFTAARQKDNGGLAVRLPDGPERRERPSRMRR